MGDYPLEELKGHTPLQVAHIPSIRSISAKGTTIQVKTVPDSMQPGSDVANLSLLGYNPLERYTGRAPIEAAGANIPLMDSDIAFRCNLVTIEDGRMIDYSAGDISSEEAHELIDALNQDTKDNDIHFHGGVSYRHLMVWNHGTDKLQTQPPHDIAEQPIADYLPTGEQEDRIRELMDRSRSLFAEHPVNIRRKEKGLRPATQIWLWGQGKRLSLDTYSNRFQLKGGCHLCRRSYPRSWSVGRTRGTTHRKCNRIC